MSWLLRICPSDNYLFFSIKQCREKKKGLQAQPPFTPVYANERFIAVLFQQQQ